MLNAILLGAVAYASAGLLFAVPFLLRWVGRLDPDAVGSTSGFRLLILPGTIALWPMFAWRLLRHRYTPPTERNAHRGRST